MPDFVRTWRTCILRTVAALALSLAPLTASAQALALAQPGVVYASTGYNDGGRFLTIDRDTGAGTLVGSTGIAAMSGLAIDSQGRIFGTDPGLDTENPTSNLYRIDAATGAATLIGNTGVLGVDAIAFDQNGTLYGAETFDQDKLYTINPDTAAATLVGTMGIPDRTIAGLAVDPTTGILYGSTGSNDDLIYTISKSTGAATLVGSTGLGTSIPDITFDGTGQMYGISGNAASGSSGVSTNGTGFGFISINKATGAGTPIGPTGFGSVSGLAMMVVGIPAVGGAGLAMLATLLGAIGVVTLGRCAG